MSRDRRQRKQRIDVLRTIPLFRCCTRKQLERIDAIGAPLFVPPGRTLATSGTRGQDCFVVVSGVASATRNDIVMGTIENGTIGGELALLDGAVRSATVVSLSWMRLLVLTPSEFEELLETAPCVEDLVLHTASRRRRALEAVGAPQPPSTRDEGGGSIPAQEGSYRTSNVSKARHPSTQRTVAAPGVISAAPEVAGVHRA